MSAARAWEDAGVLRLGFLRDADWLVPDDFDSVGQEEIIRLFEGED